VEYFRERMGARPIRAGGLTHLQLIRTGYALCLPIAVLLGRPAKAKKGREGQDVKVASCAARSNEKYKNGGIRRFHPQARRKKPQPVRQVQSNPEQLP